jgi:hypothetical protein
VQPSGSDRRSERLVVAFVLVGMALGEVGDRSVELVVLTQVLGNRDRACRLSRVCALATAFSARLAALAPLLDCEASAAAPRIPFEYDVKRMARLGRR